MKIARWSIPSFLIGLLYATFPVAANPDLGEDLDLDPDLIEKSPVLQRWREEVPDILEEIRFDPSFQTQLEFGYIQYPSSNDSSGWKIGVEDIFFGETGGTVSLSYSESLDHNRAHLKSDFSYFLLPLGSYFNVAPVMGYHYLRTEDDTDAGVNLGLELRLVLSRTGAAEIRLSQTFLSPLKESEVGLTHLSASYSLTQNFRLSVEIEKQNARQGKESQVGILTQWQIP